MVRHVEAKPDARGEAEPKRSAQVSKSGRGMPQGPAGPVTVTAESLTAAAKSRSTRMSYQSDLRHFEAHGGELPATVAMVVDYLVHFSGKLAVATLKRRLCAVHVEHIDRGLQSPVRAVQVTRALQGICRTYGTAQRQVKAIVRDDLLQLLGTLGERSSPLAAARDRALLLVGFAGAFRRSELVALTVGDVSSSRHGLELRIRRSKTDQTGKGRTVFIPVAKGSECPAAALRAWLEASGIKQGAIFRSVSRSGALGGSALTPQSVALIVKLAMRRSFGGDAAAQVAGHSLRAGYCTEAAQAGLQSHQIREQTGHTSDATLARYIRPASRRAIPSLL